MTKVTTVPSPPYPKPPITEAVIALHFPVALDDKAIEDFIKKLKGRFPRREDMVQMSTSFNFQTKFSSSSTKKIGQKLQSADGTNVVMLLYGQMVVSHLSPYRGWEALFDDAQQLWGVLTKKAKQKSVSHISTRYINRIDVPVNASGGIELHEYFSAGLSLPPYAQTLSLEGFNFSCSLKDIDRRYILSIAAVPSPLIDHLSFLIDIDCASVDQLPKKADDIWKAAESLRKYKNDMFESCITDKTRMLFR